MDHSVYVAKAAEHKASVCLETSLQSLLGDFWLLLYHVMTKEAFEMLFPPFGAKVEFHLVSTDWTNSFTFSSAKLSRPAPLSASP
ncbi:hypothetical protein AVEN_30803-1 [Araneus ventricosus]|uniref:Uncharacterized protein n=1 Tax=Araneus ventricosus TaxID=182803 RepID=A0A4Y2KVL2_ARAVE|nr:hypothetical protein AVEN_30803-1 [Araneus ventricosus]